MKKIQLLVLLLISSLLFSCTQSSPLRNRRAPQNSYQVDRLANVILWDVGKSIEGENLLDPNITKGDQYLERGNIDEAFEHYQLAQENILAKKERGLGDQLLSDLRRQNLAIRWAMFESYNHKTEKGLKLLTEYFSRLNIPVDKVSGGAALAMGALYYNLGDQNQALAWYNAAIDRGSPTIDLVNRSKYAIARLITNSPDSELIKYQSVWSKKPLIVALAKQELDARSGVNVTNSQNGLNLKFAALLPLTGKYSILGTSTRQGLELALKHAGQDLSSLQLIDTSGDLNQAVKTLTQLKSTNSVDLVIGPMFDEPVLIKAIRDLGVPAISLSKRQDASIGGSIFRLGITPTSQVMSLVEVFKSRQVNSVAILYPENQIGQEMAKAMLKLLEDSGIRVTINQNLKSGNLNTAELASKIEALSADALFYSGRLEEIIPVLSAFSSQYRARLLPAGTALWHSPGKLQSMLNILNGSIFVVPYFRGEDSERNVSVFDSMFRDNFNQEPNFLAAQGYDVLRMINEKTVGEQSVLSALKDPQPFFGVTGELSSTSSGEIRRRYAVVEFRDGLLRKIN